MTTLHKKLVVFLMRESAETCFLFKFFPLFNREASVFCRVDGFGWESEACQQ